MAIYPQWRYIPSGDSALTVEIGDEICPGINRIVNGLASALESGKIPGIQESIPTYRSLLILYDPAELWFDELIAHVKELESLLAIAKPSAPRILEIPVVYGGTYGPDIDVVANHAGVSQDALVRLHTERDYLVYMLGFTPGFCYLGGLNNQLETPRLSEPRTCIPAGSVGIAGKQTGVYPIESPGGWQLIGRTPLKFFNPERNPAVLVNAGDYIRFTPIFADQWRDVVADIERGLFMPRIVNETPRTGETA